MALVLDRANDPTSMLAGDWGSRQAALQALNDTNTLWMTYGAEVTQYNNAVDFIQNTLGLTVLDETNSNYISSAASRTIWIEIDTQAEWQQLFGPDSTLMYAPHIAGQQRELWYWDGSLSLPTELVIDGIWVDQSARPGAVNIVPGVEITLVEGAQSIGNLSANAAVERPQHIADLYNFPLDGSQYQTGVIGLIEPATGSWTPLDPTGASFQQQVVAFLQSIDNDGNPSVYVQGANGQSTSGAATGMGERSLDVGIATAVNPNSDLALYVGSGSGPATGNAQSSVFTAIQSSIWGTAVDATTGLSIGPAPVTSSSWNDVNRIAPLSPFYQAYAQLFIDAALINQTTLIASGDGGSSSEVGNGVRTVLNNHTSPYNILVGGSSLSPVSAAEQDPTLTGTSGNPDFTAIYNLAMAGDAATLWQLMSGGLTELPSAASESAWLVETVWNRYQTVAGQQFADGREYWENNASTGGVDPTTPTPGYQTDFGLTSSNYHDLVTSGRGVPDVSAAAGGNLYYIVPNPDMIGLTNESGTSASTPFWAGLITQINYVFSDQGLPNLGYMNDLLYLAAVIAPGSFHDVTMGNNISSFSIGGANYGGITPTGYGYEAAAGYDLTTGLGSPNGMLLARALAGIAHSQVYFSATPDVVDSNGAGGWTSGIAQTLLLQTVANADATVAVDTGATTTDASSAAHAVYAWTSQLAQQSLQIGFDGTLLALFDGQAQGTLAQAIVANGDTVSVTFNGNTTVAAQAGMSASFGFADFFSDAGNSVRLAQAVAVAETAGGHDDVNVVVRMRQVAGADLSLMLYKVDDYNGTINGVAPDQASYAAAAAGRAYAVMGGGTTIAGPGDGNAGQAQITGVDAGDLIAMQLTNVTNGDTFWAFSQANEVVGGEHVAHLWNYGANTWGWEDLHGGGDRDFNDLIVQLDFTSTAGSGLLVT